MVGRRPLLFMLLLASYVIYLVIGACVFCALEQPYEQMMRDKLLGLWAEFMESHPCLSEELLEDFLQRALLMKSFGIPVLRNLSGFEVKWDFVSSLFFTGTTLTTIGYGHPFPISENGKLFCLLYSVIGIPFTLSLLSISAQNLLILLRDKPIRLLLLQCNISRNKLEWIHALVLISVLSLLVFFIPAFVFDFMEGNWSYVDALYYCFISLSTVGLGDYIPGEQTGQRMPALYKILVIGYLLIGLTAVFLVVEILKSCLKCSQFFNLFLLECDENRRFEEMESVPSHDSEVPIVPKPEETTRRRVPHSTSPTETKSYGTINLSFS